MPPALHPKSTQTLSLFTTTLVLGFGVVTLPHVFPCPVDHKRRVFADGDTPERRRKRRIADSGTTTESKEPLTASDRDSDMFTQEPSKRECPVPKPSGYLGQLLGFGSKTNQRETAVQVETTAQSSVKS
jgi:cytochrome c oxidase assembly factor 2